MTGIIKRGLSRASGSPAFTAFVRGLERFGDRQTNLLRVLTYHRVDEPQTDPDLAPRLISATPADFVRQVEYLAENCHVVSMEEVLEAVRGRGVLPPRSVAITFDDAYRDFADVAWPILRRHGLGVTLFVPTGFPDQPGRVFWWDRLHRALRCTTRREPLDTPAGRVELITAKQRAHAFRHLAAYVKASNDEQARTMLDGVCRVLGVDETENRVLDWESLRQLSAEGVTLAAHTRTHPLMNRIPLEQARAEAVGSLDDLRRQIGEVLPVFAYPGGAMTDRVASMLVEQGFRLALTTRRGVNDLRSADRMQLRRINVGRRTNETILRAELLPWTVHFNRWMRLV